jgi:hypothetical protein
LFAVFPGPFCYSVEFDGETQELRMLRVKDASDGVVVRKRLLLTARQ